MALCCRNTTPACAWEGDSCGRSEQLGLGKSTGFVPTHILSEANVIHSQVFTIVMVTPTLVTNIQWKTYLVFMCTVSLWPRSTCFCNSTDGSCCRTQLSSQCSIFSSQKPKAQVWRRLTSSFSNAIAFPRTATTSYLRVLSTSRGRSKMRRLRRRAWSAPRSGCPESAPIVLTRPEGSCGGDKMILELGLKVPRTSE